MPAERFTKKANTPKKKRQWQHVEDSMLDRGASKKAAIMAASGVVKKGKKAKPKDKKGA